MSGHSKWSTIKRKKEKTDNARAKVFTKIGREIAVAVKEGGPDPAGNSKLKDVIAKAKAANVPNDNIDRIIKVGAVADRAQFVIREMHIADRSVQNIKVTVYNNLKTDWLIGQETLKQFGDYEFDTNSMKLIFNKEK